nr:vitamin K-dependent protein Z isoform X6 [Vicugna pacos]
MRRGRREERRRTEHHRWSRADLPGERDRELLKGGKSTGLKTETELGVCPKKHLGNSVSSRGASPSGGRGWVSLPPGWPGAVSAGGLWPLHHRQVGMATRTPVLLLLLLLALLAPHRAQPTGGSPCISQPCLNNGSCQDSIRSYTCTCAPGYEGRDCAFSKNGCHPSRTDGCQHFCHPGPESYTCSCAEGHTLGPDHKSCLPHESCACGTLTPQRSKQELQVFPWQVKLANSEGKDFCGGVIIQENVVLTTAGCSLRYRNISVRATPTLVRSCRKSEADVKHLDVCTQQADRPQC